MILLRHMVLHHNSNLPPVHQAVPALLSWLRQGPHQHQEVPPLHSWLHRLRHRRHSARQLVVIHLLDMEHHQPLQHKRHLLIRLPDMVHLHPDNLLLLLIHLPRMALLLKQLSPLLLIPLLPMGHLQLNLHMVEAMEHQLPLSLRPIQVQGLWFYRRPKAIPMRSSFLLSSSNMVLLSSSNMVPLSSSNMVLLLSSSNMVLLPRIPLVEVNPDLLIPMVEVPMERHLRLLLIHSRSLTVHLLQHRLLRKINWFQLKVLLPNKHLSKAVMKCGVILALRLHLMDKLLLLLLLAEKHRNLTRGLAMVTFHQVENFMTPGSSPLPWVSCSSSLKSLLIHFF
jgi:hypothetical protein